MTNLSSRLKLNKECEALLLSLGTTVDSLLATATRLLVADAAFELAAVSSVSHENGTDSSLSVALLFDNNGGVSALAGTRTGKIFYDAYAWSQYNDDFAFGVAFHETLHFLGFTDQYLRVSFERLRPGQSFSNSNRFSIEFMDVCWNP